MLKYFIQSGVNNHLCSVLTVHVRVLKGIFLCNNIVEIFLYSIMNSTTVGSMDPSFASDSCRRPGFDDNPEIRQSTEEKSISQQSEAKLGSMDPTVVEFMML